MKGRYAGAAASKGSIQVPLSTLDDLFAETDYEMWIFV